MEDNTLNMFSAEDLEAVQSCLKELSRYRQLIYGNNVFSNLEKYIHEISSLFNDFLILQKLHIISKDGVNSSEEDAYTIREKLSEIGDMQNKLSAIQDLHEIESLPEGIAFNDAANEFASLIKEEIDHFIKNATRKICW